jgi:anti-sigma factor RsiW
MPARTCAFRADVGALVDGRLPERRARALEGHLRGCPACSAEHAALQGLREQLRALPAEPLPEGFAGRLQRRLAVAPSPARRPWPALAAMPVAAALCGFVAAAAMARPLLRPRGPEEAAAAASAVAAGGGPVPIGRSTPSLFPIPASSTAPAAAVENGPVAAAAAAPPAVSLTLLARAPDEVVRTLSDLVIGGGGEVITTYLGPASSGSATSASSASALAPGPIHPVAAVDAVIPESSVPAYTRDASALGTVLAKVDDTPDEPGLSVRMIVTVLADSHPQAGEAAHRSLGWERRVLLAAGRAAPYAALALGALALGGGVARALRRYP